MSGVARAPFVATDPLPDGTALLEASAGTGKTHTITSLVLRLVAEHGVALDRILVVTFTRAAAAELRERVWTRLSAAVDVFEREHGARSSAAPGGTTPDLAEVTRDDDIVGYLLADARVLGTSAVADRLVRLRTARERFDDATIDTIHGFCQRTLRSAAPDVDLDLGVELTEDLGPLLDELVTDHLIATLRHADPAWYRLLVANKVSRARLLHIARRLEQEPHLHLHPDGPDVTDPTVVWDELCRRFRVAWRASGGPLHDEVADLIVAKAFSGSARPFNRKAWPETCELLDAWCDSATPPLGELGEVEKRIPHVGRAYLSRRLKDPVDLPGGYDDLLDAADALCNAPLTLATAYLVDFARRARTEIPRRKAARGLLSFSDLLAALDRALHTDAPSREAVRGGIRQRFDVALIDEFQDTDPVQWRIFDTVFGSGAAEVGDGAVRLHLIGDPKQAIYGFRGGDVRTYLAAAATVPMEHRATLATNYRSDQRYLDALEVVFGRNGFDDGVFGTPGIDHVPVQASADHRDDRLRTVDGSPLPALELRYLAPSLTSDEGGPDRGDEPPADAPISRGWARTHVPRLVAHEIAQTLEQAAELEVGGVWRRLVPEDLAVLTRTNDQARRVQAALQEAGIPAVVGSDHRVVDTAEALAVQRLLEALLAPGDERLVRAACAGPLIGRTAAELDDPDDATWDRWLEQLDGWARTWRRAGIAVALREVLAATAAARRLVARPRGERILTNVLHLGELLHRAETRARLGPEGLTAWLREQRHGGGDAGDDLELRLESDADAVTIVTVHRSKGLQYPVVWCPYLWDGADHVGSLVRNDDRDVLRVHDAGALHLDLDLDRAGPKAARLDAAARERWEENLRFLYVALTRAKHRCVVVAGPFKGVGASALHRVLHAAPFEPAGSGKGPADPPPERYPDLRAGLDDLAGLAPDALAVTDVAPLTGRTVWKPPQHGSTLALQVRVFGRRIDRSWQRTSFSRLTSGAPHGDGSPTDDGLDHDQSVLDVRDPLGSDGDVDAGGSAVLSIGRGAGPLAATTAAGLTTLPPVDAADGPEVPLAGFPRGADPGTFLHHVLEQLDFEVVDDRDAIDAVVASRLDRAGLAGVDRSALLDGLQAVLRTPLGVSLPSASTCLADLARHHRADELEFDLPIAGGYVPTGDALTLGRLAEVFEAHASASAAPLAAFAARLRARADDPPARGFLTGSIDLVARIDDRYLVIDYKSNWLGERVGGPEGPWRSTVGHYHPARLAAEMVSHDYVLQYHLYLVALHRLLRWRLGDRYDYDRDVAGAAYLFLRGMVGAEVPRDDHGTPHGVYLDRPSRALIDDLDALMRGEGRQGPSDDVGPPAAAAVQPALFGAAGAGEARS